MSPVTKFSKVIVDGARVPSLLSHALLTAESEKPWAVHLELPEDIAGEMIDDHYAPITYEKVRRPVPDKKAIQILVDKLNEAKKPMILVWAWANRKRVTTYLTKFIEQHNIPFFTSQMWKWVVDERLSQYIGTAALTSNDHLHKVIQQADLILAIGHDTIEKPTHIIQEWETEVIHISFTTAEYDELYKPTLQIVWDIWNTMWHLTEEPIESSSRDYNQIYIDAKKAKETLVQFAQGHYNNEIMMPARIINELREVLWEKDIIALDNGLYKVWFARNYPCYTPNTLLLDNALATMWAWYSTAMMAKILHPKQQVVCVTWDGWFMMNLWDIETAVKLDHDLTIIIVNDNAYGMIKWKQVNHGYTDFWLDLNNPDFVALAHSFWAKGYRIDSPSDFWDLMKNILKEKGVKIVEVPFRYPEKIQ